MGLLILRSSVVSAPPEESLFPLEVSSNGRYVQGADGTPFLLVGDTPWSGIVQLSTAQMAAYMDVRKGQGHKALMVNIIEHFFSSQTPFYEDVDGNVPFTGMAHNSVDWEAPVEAYWTRVDTWMDLALERNLAVFAFPAYLGFGGGGNSANDQGWDTAVNNSTNGDLQAYGAWLANRYANHPNIVWCMGGDYNALQVAKQWNIATGILSVNADALITYHGGRGTSGYTNANGQTGFNLNNIYCGTDGVSYDDAATEYARAGPLPMFLIEGGYEGAQSLAVCRLQTYQALCSGACGAFYGNFPVWGFGEPNANGGEGPADAIANHLDDTGAIEFGYAIALFTAYDWHLLEPATDDSLVTTSLGSGSSRACPALASDGSFAMVYKPASGEITVDMSALTAASVRARFFSPTAGTFSTVSGSPFSNSGTQNITFPGERVLVLDAA